MRWPSSSRAKYLLLEAITVSLTVAAFILVTTVVGQFPWGWRVILTVALAVIALGLQLRLRGRLKPRWGLFSMFLMSVLMVGVIVAYHSDRPAALKSDRIPADWLDLAIFLPILGIVSMAAEQVFGVVRPWLGWRRYPNLPFEVITITALLATSYLAGLGHPGPTSIIGQLALGGGALAVAFVGLWFLPLRWAPRSVLLWLIVLGIGTLDFGKLMGVVILGLTIGYVIGTLDRNTGSIYAMWARRKGLPVATEG